MLMTGGSLCQDFIFIPSGKENSKLVVDLSVYRADVFIYEEMYPLQNNTLL